MTEEIQMGIDEAKDQMSQAISHLNSELLKIATVVSLMVDEIIL